MKKMIIALSVLLAGCSAQAETLPLETVDFTERTFSNTAPLKVVPQETETRVSVSAIGDILLHAPVYNNAWNGTEYNFNPMFEDIKPYIEDTTLSMANQETMIGGEAFGLSSYPSFNSPQAIGDTLKWAGIDLVTLANNHTLDRGEKVIQSALDYWDKIGIPYDGAYRSEEDANRLRIIKSKDIDISFLSYTYGTNGIPVPNGKDYLVNLLDKEKMTKDLEKARTSSDIQIVSMHFGQEYQRMPNEEQKEWVKWLSEQGVDVVVGHHPHVLQPIDWVENSEGENMLVIYSLGNFLSNQKGDYMDIGGIAKFDIVKNSSRYKESFSIEKPKFIPTFSGKDVNGKFKINKLSEKNPQKFNEISKHMSQWLPDLILE